MVGWFTLLRSRKESLRVVSFGKGFVMQAMCFDRYVYVVVSFRFDYCIVEHVYIYIYRERDIEREMMYVGLFPGHVCNRTIRFDSLRICSERE